MGCSNSKDGETSNQNKPEDKPADDQPNGGTQEGNMTCIAEWVEVARIIWGTNWVEVVCY